MKKITALLTVILVALSVTIVSAQPPQGGERKMPTTEERVEQLKEKLDLNEEQCAQITEMYDKSEKPERGNREAMKKMMDAEKEQMEKILTKKQYTKWEKLMAKQRPQGH